MVFLVPLLLIMFLFHYINYDINANARIINQENAIVIVYRTSGFSVATLVSL